MPLQPRHQTNPRAPDEPPAQPEESSRRDPSKGGSSDDPSKDDEAASEVDYSREQESDEESADLDFDLADFETLKTYALDIADDTAQWLQEKDANFRGHLQAIG